MDYSSLFLYNRRYFPYVGILNIYLHIRCNFVGMYFHNTDYLSMVSIVYIKITLIKLSYHIKIIRSITSIGTRVVGKIELLERQLESYFHYHQPRKTFQVHFPTTRIILRNVLEPFLYQLQRQLQMELVFQYFFRHSSSDFLYIERVGKIHLNHILVLIITSSLDFSADVSGKNDCLKFYPSLSYIRHMAAKLNSNIKKV